MRFLHTADIHLGKRLNDISLLEDQKYILDQIVGISREKKVDAVLISGDVYQRAAPDSGAMEVFNGFLSALAAEGKKVFIISGNHDSDKRISYYSSLIRPSGIYVSERFEGVLQKHTLEDEYGEIDIHLFPFVKPINIRRFYPEEEISTYQQMSECILRHSEIDCGKRNVILAHQYIIGAELSDSEELAVGGLDSVDGAVFDKFDYAALGHIHKPQRAGRQTVRYAGSPLKYSFSEMKGKKSVVIFEMKTKGDFSVETVELEPLREMREVRGSLESITEMPYSEDYFRIVVTDEFVPPDAKLSCAAVFPNMMRFVVSNSKTECEEEIFFEDGLENKSVSELFEDFFKFQTDGAEPSEEHISLLNGILEEMGGRARETD